MSHAPARILAVALLVAFAGSSAGQSVTDKKKATAYMSHWDISKRGVTQPQLGRWLDLMFDDEMPKFLVFTQCYGGDFADHPAIKGLPGAAVVSADKVGEEADNGGYHDDAARALKPANGRTAKDVHAAGKAGKADVETPLVRGTLALDKFSIESTSKTGAVRARVIVVYLARPISKEILFMPNNFPGSGKPTIPLAEGKTKKDPHRLVRIKDIADRDAITKAFRGEADTTIINVGGRPGMKKQWDFPADRRGLLGAFVKARGVFRALKKTEPNLDPSKLQLILFVGDHGNDIVTSSGRKTVRKGSRSDVATGFRSSPSTPGRLRVLEATPDNQPKISVRLDMEGRNVPLRRITGGFAPLFGTGDFALTVTPADGLGPIEIADFFEDALNEDDDLVLGNNPGEGLVLHFPVDETDFRDRLLDATIDVALSNNTNDDVIADLVTQDTGALQRDTQVLADATVEDPFGTVLLVAILALVVALLALIVAFLRSR